jgi:dTDP-glucose pyrophosphorylase
MSSDNTPPSLVVLAAGVGSRFGGLKQLEPVGPDGATLLEYSLFDARRSGFGRAVFVVRPEMAEAFGAFLRSRLPASIPWSLAFQRSDTPPFDGMVPSDRIAPWGTAHAVLAGRAEVAGSFAVVNADDFYGREGFEAVSRFLKLGRDDWALVGYRLADTLSASGGVNRGLIEYSAEGALTGVEEVLDITRDDEDGSIVGLGAMGPRFLREDTLVSMNLWGFTPAVFDALEAGLARFVANADLRRDEYPLPTAIQDVLERSDQRVRILAARSQWFGVTYAADLDRVRQALRRLVEAGAYPERLWS